MLNLLTFFLFIPILFPIETNKFIIESFSEITFDDDYIYIYDDYYTCDPKYKYFILKEKYQYQFIDISLSSNKSCYYIDFNKNNNPIKQNKLDTFLFYDNNNLYFIDKYSEDCIQIKYTTEYNFFVFDKSGEFSYNIFRSQNLNFLFNNTINKRIAFTVNFENENSLESFNVPNLINFGNNTLYSYHLYQTDNYIMQTEFKIKLKENQFNKFIMKYEYENIIIISEEKNETLKSNEKYKIYKIESSTNPDDKINILFNNPQYALIGNGYSKEDKYKFLSTEYPLFFELKGKGSCFSFTYLNQELSLDLKQEIFPKIIPITIINSTLIAIRLDEKDLKLDRLDLIIKIKNDKLGLSKITQSGTTLLNYSNLNNKYLYHITFFGNSVLFINFEFNNINCELGKLNIEFKIPDIINLDNDLKTCIDANENEYKAYRIISTKANYYYISFNKNQLVTGSIYGLENKRLKFWGNIQNSKSAFFDLTENNSCFNLIFCSELIFMFKYNNYIIRLEEKPAYILSFLGDNMYDYKFITIKIKNPKSIWLKLINENKEELVYNKTRLNDITYYIYTKEEDYFTTINFDEKYSGENISISFDFNSNIKNLEHNTTLYWENYNQLYKISYDQDHPFIELKFNSYQYIYSEKYINYTKYMTFKMVNSSIIIFKFAKEKDILYLSYSDKYFEEEKTDPIPDSHPDDPKPKPGPNPDPEPSPDPEPNPDTEPQKNQNSKDSNKENNYIIIPLILFAVIILIIIIILIIKIIKKRKKENSLLFEETKKTKILNEINNIEMLGLEEELLSDVSKTELKERHDDIIEEKDTNKNILEEIKNEVHDTPKYKENLNINIQKSNTPNEKTENIIISKEIDIPNKEIIQENNSQKNIDNKKKEKSNSNILLNDIWENDDEEDIHIDDKINKMLDLYFRKSEEKKDLLSSKTKDNGEHLSINLVELRNYKDDTNNILAKVYDYEEKYLKYQDLNENIEDSKCFTNLKEEKYGLSPFRSNKTLFYLCLLYTFVFYLLLLTLKKNLIGIITIIIIFIIGSIFQFFYIYRNYYWNCKQLKGEYLKKLESILNAEPNLELYYDDRCIINIPFHSYADVSGIQLLKNFISDEKLIIEKINLDNYLLLHFPIKYIFFVDSTQQYFKFLINQFNKYCYIKNRDFHDIYKKMYIKFK